MNLLPWKYPKIFKKNPFMFTLLENSMIKPQYQQWPFPFQNMETFVVPPQDELLVYKWEGFGRPNSTSGSLSSLESFGHVDDLDLSKLQFLEADPLNTTSSTSITPTASEDEFSSLEADYQTPHQTFTDSW